jgi:uncharacterized protein
MFKLDGGLLLNLYPRADLAKDAAIPGAGPHSESSASHNSFVAAPRRTSCWRRRRQRGTVTPAHDRPWGIYSGYFRDPDGHLWEIV